MIKEAGNYRLMQLVLLEAAAALLQSYASQTQHHGDTTRANPTPGYCYRISGSYCLKLIINNKSKMLCPE